MALLFDLPSELVLHIVELLPPHDLLNISLTNKHAWQLARSDIGDIKAVAAKRKSLAIIPPFNSSSDYGDDVGPDGEPMPWAHIWTASYWTALNELYTHPRTAYLIQELDNDRDWESSEDDNVGDAIISADCARLCEMTGVDPGWVMAAQEDSSATDSGRLFATLLLLLPRLRELRFTEHSSKEASEFILRTLREIATLSQCGQSNALRHLTHAVISHWDDEGGIDIEWCQALISLPAMRHFVGTQVDIGAGGLRAVPTLPMSKITSLEFKSSCFDARSLEVLITKTSSLQKFYYEHGGPVVGDTGFDGPGFVNVLAKYAGGTLLDLSLLCEHGVDGGFHHWTQTANLKALTKLERLDTMLEILAFDAGDPRTFERLFSEHYGDLEGSDAVAAARTTDLKLGQRLPPTLKHLKLGQFYQRYIPHFVSYVQEHASSGMQLQKLDLVTWFIDADEAASCASLKEVCDAAGVQLEVVGLGEEEDEEDYEDSEHEGVADGLNE